MRLGWSALVDCVTPTSPEGCVDQIELSASDQITGPTAAVHRRLSESRGCTMTKKEKSLVQSTCNNLLRMHDCTQVDCKHNRS